MGSESSFSRDLRGPSQLGGFSGLAGFVLHASEVRGRQALAEHLATPFFEFDGSISVGHVIPQLALRGWVNRCKRRRRVFVLDVVVTRAHEFNRAAQSVVEYRDAALVYGGTVTIINATVKGLAAKAILIGEVCVARALFAGLLEVHLLSVSVVPAVVGAGSVRSQGCCSHSANSFRAATFGAVMEHARRVVLSGRPSKERRAVVDSTINPSCSVRSMRLRAPAVRLARIVGRNVLPYLVVHAVADALVRGNATVKLRFAFVTSGTALADASIEDRLALPVAVDQVPRTRHFGAGLGCRFVAWSWGY